ncbi:MAG: transcriptional regulator [Gaiellales bacterium]|nr:transcriptional regulator [Gaiellales bacterium]
MKQPPEQALSTATEIFARAGGILRASAAIKAGIQPRTLYWMRDENLLEPLSRGVYHLSALPLPPQPDVIAVAQRVPDAVLCLISALDFYEVGTQVPAEVQIALPRGTKAPWIDCPRIRVFHMSEASLQAGVEVTRVGSTLLRVFGVAKTAADCFKYRNRIGLNVALEALQEVLRERRATPGEIMEFAEIDRVSRIVRPYLEALL